HARLEHNLEQRARFTREVRIQSRLNHPGVVPLFEAGSNQGLPYFAMKRVHGRVLSEILASSRLGDESTLERFDQYHLLQDFTRVAWTVAFAHSRGVVHRDIKPSNVMLGEYGEVYLLDWGVASERPRDASPVTPLGTAPADLTDPSQALGTPAYMSPEHARGGAGPEPSSDVFALGAMLFEVLTLKRLNPGSGANEAMQLAAAPIERRALEVMNTAQVPPRLQDLVLRAVAFDSDERPSARELALSVERFLADRIDVEDRRQRAEAERDRAIQLLAEREEGQVLSALRALNHASALTPDDDDAPTLLARLLLRADELDPRYRDDLGSRLQAHRTDAVRWSLRAMVPVGLFAGMLLWVTGGALLAVSPAILSFVLLAAWLGRASRLTRVPDWHYYVSGPLGALAAASLTVVAGPFALPPLGVLAHFPLLFMNSRAEARMRATQIAVALSAIYLPFCLQLTGVLPSTYLMENGHLVISPIGFEVSPTRLWWFVAGGSLVLTTATLVFLGRLSQKLERAQRQLFAQRWVLSRMVPRLGNSLESAPRDATGGSSAGATHARTHLDRDADA
ncbi:MAG: protein kinase, partial [Myxococcales bacterium]|nr:protein kinase [Myxococcales bacterium]